MTRILELMFYCKIVFIATLFITIKNHTTKGNTVKKIIFMTGLLNLVFATVAEEFKVTYSLGQELMNLITIIYSRISETSQHELEKHSLKQSHKVLSGVIGIATMAISTALYANQTTITTRSCSQEVIAMDRTFLQALLKGSWTGLHASFLSFVFFRLFCAKKKQITNDLNIAYITKLIGNETEIAAITESLKHLPYYRIFIIDKWNEKAFAYMPILDHIMYALIGQKNILEQQTTLKFNNTATHNCGE